MVENLIHKAGPYLSSNACIRGMEALNMTGILDMYKMLIMVAV